MELLHSNTINSLGLVLKICLVSGPMHREDRAFRPEAARARRAVRQKNPRSAPHLGTFGLGLAGVEATHEAVN